MKMYKLAYFVKSNGICADDFNNEVTFNWINLNYLVSVSQMQMFKLPFSGKSVKKYAVVTMVNDDQYFIHEDSYNDLLPTLDISPL